MFILQCFVLLMCFYCYIIEILNIMNLDDSNSSTILTQVFKIPADYKQPIPHQSVARNKHPVSL